MDNYTTVIALPGSNFGAQVSESLVGIDCRDGVIHDIEFWFFNEPSVLFSHNLEGLALLYG